GQPLSLIDAVFTATSAVCVTGLIVRDTASAFTPFGQIVILVLIQVGGLSYMVLATSAAVLLGRRLGVKDRATLRQAFNLDTAAGMGRFLRSVLWVTLAAELAGAVVITLAYMKQVPPSRAAALGVFHAVSAFNNAGFSLFADNLAGVGRVPLVVAAVSLLVILGGLGFFVLREFIDLALRRRHKLSLHAKLVLATTALLLALGAAGLWLTAGGSFMQAAFLSVSARTAGFNIQDTGALPTGTLFLLLPLMFIGASPGGTGGGIKTTTLALVLLAVWATLQGRSNIVVYKRQVVPETIFKALMVAVSMGVVLIIITAIMVVWENQKVIKVMFEVVSALGTVGLSTGDGGVLSLSARFSAFGKSLIVAAMFIGRLGPLTLGLATAFHSHNQQVKFPEGRVSIG
ncbi:hypothetical protein JW933_05150, partial [candidate division FCPU426 bacterium]|nr:hypothetical protein [candidate division FCPU426 bacterium]